jgi:hypothetical protein
MAIPVACECGKKFRAKDEHAGKRTRCPGCGTELRIGHPCVPPIPLPAADSFNPAKNRAEAGPQINQGAEPSIALTATYRPFVGKEVHYHFRVFGPNLQVHRESESSSDEWTLPHSVAQATVRIGTLNSMSFIPPRENRVKLSLSYDSNGLHERKRLHAWLDGDPVPPAITGEQVKERETRAIKEAGAFLLAMPLAVAIGIVAWRNANVGAGIAIGFAASCYWAAYFLFKGLFGVRDNGES